ncbi:MAG: alpha/beta fold hydrolase [Vicinamibacterales bacterium]
MARRSLEFRLARGLIAGIAATYLLIVGALWYWQAAFIFLPSSVVDITPGDSGVTFTKVALPIGSGQLAGWWVPAENPQTATLLYLHGNANNIGANAQDVVRFHNAGVNVFIFDYRGFGESTGGPPREKLVYEDAERAWTYLVSERRLSSRTIAIYGHSLGSAVAVDLASKHPEAGALIIEGVLTSIADVANEMPIGLVLPVRLIVTERFDAISKIGSVRIPTLILEGSSDRPLRARRLYDSAREPKQLALIPGGGHEDSAETNPKAYFDAFDSFLSRYGLKSEPTSVK